VRETGNVPACLSAAVRNKIYTLLAEEKTGYHFVQPFENMISTATADSSFNQKEINHLLYLGMQTLPEKRREIFRLPYYEGASTRQISEYLNISQKTVQNQLLPAFQDLRLHISHYMVTAGAIIILSNMNIFL